MSIKTKLIVLVAVPFLFLGALCGTLSMDAVATSKEMESFEQLSELAVCFSALVHETQKERGRTAGYLGSKGSSFASELEQQRRLTDSRLAELDSFLEGFSPSAFGPEFEQDLAQARGRLDELGAMRSRISSLEASTPEAIGFYTSFNGGALDLIGSFMHLGSEEKLVRLIGAYSSFLKGKERAGIERAVLANTFAKDAFGPGMFAKAASLISEQRIYLHEFRGLGTEAGLAALDAAESDPSFAAVQSYRDIAFANAATGGFETDAGAWFSTITAKINKLKEVENTLSEELKSEAAAIRSEASIRAGFLMGGTAALALVLVGVAFWTIRSITKPIASLAERMESVRSTNDLMLRADVRGSDEIAHMGVAFNSLIETLHAIIVEVRTSSEQVAAAATEVAASSDELMSSMDAQATDVNGIVQEMSEMSGQTAQVIRASGEAENEAKASGAAAESGGAIVIETLECMRSLNSTVTESTEAVNSLGKRSDEIGAIIGVINEIADQTTLLALNAAIEAARAGEHGRGFAIVADEVRKLADRTTSATDEIASSIHLIQGETRSAVERMDAGLAQVETGVEQASTASGSLEQIVRASSAVSTTIQEITRAASAQAEASDRVRNCVNDIAKTSERSREVTAQANQAAFELSTKAEEMAELVRRFRTA